MLNKVSSSVSSLLLASVLAAGCTPGPEPTVESIEDEILTTGQINGSGLPSKTVVFTYDDGPDDHTLALAKYLADEQIKATFFVNGSRFCKVMGADGKCMTPQDTRPCNNGQMQAGVSNPKYYPESLLDELLALGHRLGNHTQDHCHMNGQTNAADAIWEVKATQDILDRHICDGIFPFRAPFGEWGAAITGRLNSMMSLGQITGPINWDVDGNDWDCWQKRMSPEACATRYFNIVNGRARQNGIFLMHDRPEFNVTYDGPLQMTKILVPRLKAAGYKFGTLDDVLKIPPRDGGTGPACQKPTMPAADAGAPPVSDAAAATDSAVSAEPDASVSQPDASGAGGSGGTGMNTAGTGGTVRRDASAPATGGTGGDEDPPGGTGGSSATGRDGGGCSHGGSSPASALLLVLALALVRRRRGI